MKGVAYENPVLEEVVDLINNARDDEYLSIIGPCHVEYRGRTSTTLEYGDRHLIVKPDGTVLIHLDEKQKPKNYQKPGATVKAGLTDEATLHVHAEKKINSDTADRETVDVEFFDVYTATRVPMEDDGEFTMRGSEDDVQEHLMDNPEPISEAIGRTFVPDEKEYRHKNLGPIDIFGHVADDETVRVVCELKRRRGSKSGVQQLNRYVEGVKKTHDVDEVIGVFVAPAMSSNAQEKLEEKGFTFVSFMPSEAVETTPDSMNQSLDTFMSGEDDEE